MLSRTDLRKNECYNKINSDGSKEYLGEYQGQSPVGDFQSLFFLNGNKTHMENIKLTERNRFEKVECDKARKYSKGTARRYPRLTPVNDLNNPTYFAHNLDHDLDDKLGGRKSRIKKRKNKQSKRRKMR
jgi:hypothetical protein